MKVNWGCANTVAPGWFNSDREDYPGISHVGDLLAGLPLPDGSVEIVVANHSLQMIPYVDLPAALGELVRVLVPGGILRLLVPDVFGAEGAFAAYRRNRRDWFPVANDVERLTGGKLAAYGLWYSTARSQFTAAWLQSLVLKSGCSPAVAAVGVSMFGSDESLELDTRAGETLVVEGRKHG